MPINYAYLEDGTALVVDELNTRIEDAADGLNNLKQADIGLGAFRTEHLPCMIGRPNAGTAGISSFTKTVRLGYSAPVVDFGTFRVRNGGTTLMLTYDAGGIEVSSTSDMNALVVLFNIQVSRFCIEFFPPNAPLDFIGDGYDEKNFEDLVSVAFMLVLRVEDESGAYENVYLDKSERAISPGYAYAGGSKDTDDSARRSEYRLPGQGYKDDAWTGKNAAMRTVILPEDIPTDTKITEIWVEARTRFCSDNSDIIGITYSKASLTAIPIQATVGAV